MTITTIDDMLTDAQMDDFRMRIAVSPDEDLVKARTNLRAIANLCDDDKDKFRLADTLLMLGIVIAAMKRRGIYKDHNS